MNDLLKKSLDEYISNSKYFQKLDPKTFEEKKEFLYGLFEEFEQKGFSIGLETVTDYWKKNLKTIEVKTDDIIELVPLDKAVNGGGTFFQDSKKKYDKTIIVTDGYVPNPPPGVEMWIVPICTRDTGYLAFGRDPALKGKKVVPPRQSDPLL